MTGSVPSVVSHHGIEHLTSASLGVFNVSMGVTDADVKRIVLGTLPSTTLAGAGLFLALNGLWMFAIAAFVAAGGYIALLRLLAWRHKRDSDGSIDRAAHHDDASGRRAADPEPR